MEVTRLGFGAASIGNLYRAISDADATDAVDAAWASDIRYFDTAPHYGVGLSERRMGWALRERPRAEYTVSTKVGRLLVPDPAGASRRDDGGFAVPGELRRVWDFSADGVRRSVAESLDRLGLDRVDILLLHDPEEGPQEQALREGYPALHALRGEGVVGAIGVGSKSADVLSLFVRETDIDVVMLAGRYTLLEQPALDDLLPSCVTEGVSVLNVGVYNSGLLAVDRPHAGRHYEYSEAPPEIVERALRIADVCERHGVPLPVAALHFAAAHPAVASVVVGAGRPAHVVANTERWLAPRPPVDLWKELVAEGLLRPDAPVPGPAA